MKSLTIAELTAIRDRKKDQILLNEGKDRIRVVVGMATCGIGVCK